MTTAIVLGAAVWPDGPSPTLLRRVRHAAALYHSGEAQQLILCGGLGEHPPTEAEAMRDALLSEGVPEAAMVLEDRSTTTAENLRNAVPLLEETRVIVVSDRYHLPRALMVARRLGLNTKGSAPGAKGAKLSQQIKSTLREIPAYLLYWLRFRG